jgi:drug/metabolite transporter (DMT)-like permease
VTAGKSVRFDLGSHRSAIWLALFVTVLWSSSWVLIRWGLDDEGLTPLTFAALRYGIAAILLVGWVIFRERHRYRQYQVDRRLIVKLVLLGVLLYSVTQAALFVALDEQPAATTSLVLSLTPIFVAIGAALSLAEIPTRWQIAGAVLVVVGAWLFFAGDLVATAAGMAAAIAGLLANVASSLLGRGVNRSRQLPPVVVTAVSMGIGAGVLVFVAVGAEGVPHISTRGWLIVAWLAVVNTALAFTLWNLSLRRLSAVESAGINNTMLVQIALLAWLFLDEAPGLIGLAGIAVVTLGVYLTQNYRHAAADAPAENEMPGGQPG